MKKLILSAVIIVLICTLFGCTGGTGDVSTEDCVRIHIRANSNDESDQSVKRVVVAAVVEHLTPVLAECESPAEAKTAIRGQLKEIVEVADNALAAEGYAYTAAARLTVEEFPTRKYLNYTFEGGSYDALIIELGEGAGDNWWCVAFPPLCFIPAGEGEGDIVYKSKILEIIEQYFGRKK